MSIRNQYQWWSIVTYLLFGLMAASLLFSAIIVYNYTFRTLEDAHTIVLLNTDSVVNNVNMEMYKKALAAVEAKNKPSELKQNLRFVFAYNTSSPNPAITPSSSTDYVSSTNP